MIGFGQGQVNCSLLTVTDFFINNPGLTIDMMEYVVKTIDDFIQFKEK